MDLLSKIKSVLPITYTDEFKSKEGEKAVVQIPIHFIRQSPYQPRRTFDTEAIEELSESIKKYGVIQPITVRRCSMDSYELIAGERRLRASTMAGLLRVPAIVVDLSDNDCAVVALIENIQRENLTFLEEAEAYRNLLYRHGFTQEELAKRIGKSQSSVANKVRLLKLPSVVREIITDSHLTERHARAILSLDTEEMLLKALLRITDEGLNVAQTDEMIEKMLTPAPEPPKETERANPENKSAVFKDVRIFINTIRHAVDVMKQNGIEATSEERESDKFYEYLIQIPKG